MSDLTNTPKREPAYGKSAERHSKCARLGEAVLKIIQLRDDQAVADVYDQPMILVLMVGDIIAAARSLGLLSTEAKP